MTDLILFAALFATFIVMRNNTFGGPPGKELFSLPLALSETLLLLGSSFTCAVAMLSVHHKKKLPALLLFSLTFFLGLTFLILEIREFSGLIQEGYTWQKNGFLSAFFTLVGTHGFHISIGLLWMLVEIARIGLRPLSPFHISRTFRMALFWHFLDVVWVFIFTVVYGMEFIG